MGSHRTKQLSINKSIAASLGHATSRALSFIHSLSGGDTTSYPYFTGQKTWNKSSMQIDTAALDDFADGDQGHARITVEVVKQAKELLVSVYANKGDMFEGSDLGKHRVYTCHTQVNSAEGPTAHGERV